MTLIMNESDETSQDLKDCYAKTLRDFSDVIGKRVTLMENTREAVEDTACMVASVPKPFVKLMDFTVKECEKFRPYSDYDSMVRGVISL